MAAGGHVFEDEAEAAAFAAANMEFSTFGAYGGATSCVEIEGGDDAYLICDMGSGLREFGLDAFRRCAAGHARTYHFFLSHLHWDHIMGFPYFRPAYESGARIVVHSGHADAEQALRRQQEPISFPVPFSELKAHIEFVTHAELEYIRCIAACVTGFAGGMAPVTAVELGRRGLNTELRPTAEQMEEMFKSIKVEK